MTGEPQAVVRAACQLGEGPLWDAETGRLLWTDIERRAIHWFRPADGADGRWAVEHRVSSFGLRPGGGLVVADERGFARLDLPAPGREDEVAPEAPIASHRIAEVDADAPTVRMNDGAVDPSGRFWAGTMDERGRAEGGTLYRLDPDGTVTAMLSDITISNGIDWSPDGRTMYLADTPTGRVDAFDFDPTRGTISARRPFAVIDPEDGSPDGLTVDAEGGVWVALWGGSELRRYGPDGREDQRHTFPVSQVTKPAFGGGDLDELYVTSARDGLSPDDLAREPLAGALFRLRPGVGGRAPNRFPG